MDPRLHGCSFHGRVLRTAESSGMRISEIAYRPHLRNPQHSHENGYVGITLDGDSTQLCKNQVRSSKAWTVMFHPPGEIHSDHFHDRGARELNIELGGASLGSLSERFRSPETAVQINGGKAGWLAARLYSEFRRMDNLSLMSIEGLTIELMAEVFRDQLKPSAAKAPLWIRQVNEAIHDRYTERLTLSDLAHTVSVHPVHLARQFHRWMGCTIGQQIRQLRVDRACRLLSQSRTPLTQIALAAGFPDQSQFTKTFRHFVGMTPSEYRRLNASR